MSHPYPLEYMVMIQVNSILNWNLGCCVGVATPDQFHVMASKFPAHMAPLVLGMEVVLLIAIATDFSIPSVPRFDVLKIMALMRSTVRNQSTRKQQTLLTKKNWGLEIKCIKRYRHRLDRGVWDDDFDKEFITEIIDHEARQRSTKNSERKRSLKSVSCSCLHGLIKTAHMVTWSLFFLFSVTESLETTEYEEPGPSIRPKHPSWLNFSDML